MLFGCYFVRHFLWTQKVLHRGFTVPISSMIMYVFPADDAVDFEAVNAFGDAAVIAACWTLMQGIATRSMSEMLTEYFPT